MTDPIRVFVVDDHPVFRDGVINTLEGAPEFVVAGEADTGEHALALLEQAQPNVVLLDVTMPGQGGIATAERICATYPEIKVLMLTVSEDTDDLMLALKAGARGYLLKGVRAKELVESIVAVNEGEVVVSAPLASAILHEITRRPSVDPLDALTERERDVLELVAEGLTNREIGERLFLAEKTIKHYMTSVLQKLHVRSRVEAALIAQRRQLDRD